MGRLFVLLQFNMPVFYTHRKPALSWMEMKQEGFRDGRGREERDWEVQMAGCTINR